MLHKLRAAHIPSQMRTTSSLLYAMPPYARTKETAIVALSKKATGASSLDSHTPSQAVRERWELTLRPSTLSTFAVQMMLLPAGMGCKNTQKHHPWYHGIHTEHVEDSAAFNSTFMQSHMEQAPEGGCSRQIYNPIPSCSQPPAAL